MAPRLFALALTALIAGCFAPKVKNKGFTCVVDSTCPSGFACVNGLCDDGSGGSPPAPVEDMAMGGNGGGGDGGGGGGGGGGSSGGHDFAMPSSSDMAKSSSDMASSSGCIPSGSPCMPYHNNTNCCADSTGTHYCIYSSNTCR
jgi:hypothetical protein